MHYHNQNINFDIHLMHPRNKHQGDYDFNRLTKRHPSLAKFVKKNPMGKLTIDFASPEAVKSLNAALLACYYNLPLWDIPTGYLCPPIPGRADYIHHLADLMTTDNASEVPMGDSIVGLDIGTGANLIYPIIGSRSYGWRFIASDIDKIAIQSAKQLIHCNPGLDKQVSVRKQSNPNAIFHGVITSGDKINFTLCNPPFHSSAQAAAKGNQRKNDNLSRHQIKRGLKPQKSQKSLNFAGKSNELWCPGGELSFIKRMISESLEYKTQVQWFTSLVSKKDNLKPLIQMLKQLNAKDIRTIHMQQGSKNSRFIAWQF